MAKKKMKSSDTVELIVSGKAEMINDRFLVKGSVYNDGNNPKSVMLVVMDFLENGFKIKYFKNEQEASLLIKTLQSV